MTTTTSAREAMLNKLTHRWETLAAQRFDRIRQLRAVVRRQQRIIEKLKAAIGVRRSP